MPRNLKAALRALDARRREETAASEAWLAAKVETEAATRRQELAWSAMERAKTATRDARDEVEAAAREAAR